MPSGYSSTCADCAGSHCSRKPRADARHALVRIERRQPSLCIAERHRVVHRPQDVELELQDVERALLLGARREIVERDRQRLLDVAPRLRQAVAEVLQGPVVSIHG